MQHLRPARAAGIFFAAAVLAATAAGCGSAKSSNKSTSSGGTTAATSIRIGILLPESQTTRYEAFDRPLLVSELQARLPGVNIDYYNASQDATVQQTQVDTALTKGDKVLILDAVDSKSIQASVQKASDAGVKVVAYDRLAQGPVNAYVSYDNVKVGALQGAALLTALGSDAASKQIVMINGSPTDPNAAQFKQGALSALQGKVKIGHEYDTPNWNANNANQEMAGAITALGAANINGVYSANDGMAAGIATALTAAGIHGIPLTGQDAQLDALQRIQVGTQTMTVYKPYKPEATAAADVAVQFAQGKTPGTDLLPTTVTNGSGNTVPAKLLTPIVVDKNNMCTTVVKDGLYTAAQIGINC